MKKIFLFILSFSFLIPGFLFAQSTINQLPQNIQDLINSTPGASEELQKTYNTNLNIGNTGVQEQISFSVSPSVPRPNQIVTAEIASYSSDLNRLQISWYINDVLAKKEIGATKYQFQMGGLGQLTKLRVVILKADGTTLEKKYSFRPAEVDLISEAQTFTPPFYEGAAYYSRQAEIKVSAMPQVLDKSGKYIDPSNLSYKWYVDGSVVQSSSGYNKQTFTHKGALLSKSVQVGVEISTIDDGAVANTSVVLNPISPEVLVYEKSPTLGTLYNSVVSDSFSINRPEIEFEAAPFALNKDSILGGSTVYNWKLNGSKINSPNQNSIVFRNEKNEEGESSIGISLSNDTLLQKTSNSFNLIFNKNTNDAQF
jgi:hypothetical protein